MIPPVIAFCQFSEMVFIFIASLSDNNWQIINSESMGFSNLSLTKGIKLFSFTNITIIFNNNKYFIIHNYISIS